MLSGFPIRGINNLVDFAAVLNIGQSLRHRLGGLFLSNFLSIDKG